MNGIAWEKNSSGCNAIMQEGRDYAAIYNKVADSYLLKNIAYSKMWELSVISACFQGSGIESVFSPSTVLLLESKDWLKLYAVCRLSFTDEGKGPNLLLRSAQWDSKNDCEKFAKVQSKADYLLTDKQLIINNIFIRDEFHEKLNQLIETVEGILFSGVKFKKHQRSDCLCHTVRIKCEHQNMPLTEEIQYSPLVLENPEIEKWFLDWKGFFETEKFEKNFKPDGDIRISYESSLPELLNIE